MILNVNQMLASANQEKMREKILYCAKYVRKRGPYSGYNPHPLTRAWMWKKNMRMIP